MVDLSPTDERGLNLALNKISGDWELDALAALLEELDQSKSFDATLTGFEAAEITALIDRAAGAQDTATQLEGLEFRIVVDCKDEAHQKRLLIKFTREKLPCRALMS